MGRGGRPGMSAIIANRGPTGLPFTPSLHWMQAACLPYNVVKLNFFGSPSTLKFFNTKRWVGEWAGVPLGAPHESSRECRACAVFDMAALCVLPDVCECVSCQTLFVCWPSFVSLKYHVWTRRFWEVPSLAWVCLVNHLVSSLVICLGQWQVLFRTNVYCLS